MIAKTLYKEEQLAAACWRSLRLAEASSRQVVHPVETVFFLEMLV